MCVHYQKTYACSIQYANHVGSHLANTWYPVFIFFFLTARTWVESKVSYIKNKSYKIALESKKKRWQFQRMTNSEKPITLEK